MLGPGGNKGKVSLAQLVAFWLRYVVVGASEEDALSGGCVYDSIFCGGLPSWLGQGRRSLGCNRQPAGQKGECNERGKLALVRTLLAVMVHGR